ncbi:hypothetical protein MMC30_001463 [Trapelia coarctata]|nr:hypothetical protein [Trapelia coarctata]
MGWIWSNAPKKDNESKDASGKAVMKDAAIQTAPASPPTALPKNTRELSRDEQAEAELQSLLQELNASLSPPSSSSTSTPSTDLESPPKPPSQINHSSIHPSKLYPTTMSCRETFDSAFYCQSFGGQFTNLYRYGGMRDCSDQWSNFWFCMRTNRGYMSDGERKKKIQDHYQGRARKYERGPSSEDVWRMREERVEEAFEGDFEAVEAEMKEEWRRKRKDGGGEE